MVLSAMPFHKAHKMKKDASIITINGKQRIKIKFPFDKQAIDQVKSLDGRKFHPEPEKYWSCPVNVPNIQQLNEWGFALSKELQDLILEKNDETKFSGSLEVPSFKLELFPYQKTGVAFIEAKRGRALIGDEMGLGKTPQALAWFERHKDARPLIIVCPSSLKLMWSKSVKNWMPDETVDILYGRSETPISGKIIIVNYEILHFRVNQLIALKPQGIIIDESQNICNSTAKQTKATLKLAKRCPYVIGLSGTPIINRPIEGYNIIRLIDPMLVSASRFTYGKQFCGGHHNGFGWVFNGASNLPELRKVLKQIMLRRLKKDVLPELPPKIKTVIPTELSNREEYKNAENDFLEWVRNNRGERAVQRASNAEALTRVEILKQVAVKGKLDAARNWIDNFEGKLIVFVTHRTTAMKLKTHYPNAVMLLGGMGAKQIEDNVQQFQSNPAVKLLIGILDSRGRPAGVGHTLTAASASLFVELPWSPSVCDQAEDRCHRIGQTADCVYAYYLIAAGTIEEQIMTLLDSKRKTVDMIHDGIDTEETSLLESLLNANNH